MNTIFINQGILRMFKRHHIMPLIPLFFMALASLACVQDCLGGSFSVQGQVVDAQGNPIENAIIRVWGENDGISEAFEFSVISDSEGNFVTEYTFRFGCSRFFVSVEAQGFQAQTFTYHPPSEDFPDKLPPFIIVELSANE